LGKEVFAMDEELISKKELLETTGISYGQLYRWKRKGLIPEEWFIRKATFTGQETFFPKVKVLSRIERIKDMKEDISLDQLADVFTPTLTSQTFSREEIIARGVVSPDIFDLYTELCGGDGGPLSYTDMVMLYLIGKLIADGDISREEAKTLLEILSQASSEMGLEGAQVILLRKLGVFTALVTSPAGKVIVDGGSKVIGKITLSGVIEELKLKLL
jgi:hypothetical protein